MIPISAIVTGKGTISYRIRGKFDEPFSDLLRPIIAWNITKRCNLRCKHCYIDAEQRRGEGELNKEGALRVVDQVRELGSPLIIFSGGEPLMRDDVFDVIEYAKSRGIKVALSTNGTLITEEVARRIARAGVDYVGVSLDSPYPTWHDEFRGVKGSFDATMTGIRELKKVGVPVGFRFTVTRFNVGQVPEYLGLALRLGVGRVVLYHLSAAGRAKGLADWLPTREQYIILISYLVEFSRRHGDEVEIETAMAPFDGILVASMVAKTSDEFWRIVDLVKSRGSCGRKILSIYPDGTVRPCQFVDFVSLGNVKSERLRNLLDPAKFELAVFLEPHKFTKSGKCASCPFLAYCGGGDRVRAYYLGGGLEGSDPYCYLDVERIYAKFPR